MDNIILVPYRLSLEEYNKYIKESNNGAYIKNKISKMFELEEVKDYANTLDGAITGIPSLLLDTIITTDDEMMKITDSFIDFIDNNKPNNVFIISKVCIDDEDCEGSLYTFGYDNWLYDKSVERSNLHIINYYNTIYSICQKDEYNILNNIEEYLIYSGFSFRSIKLINIG